MKVELTGLPEIPLVEPGDNLNTLICNGLSRAGISPKDGDCLVIAQKIISKSENCYTYLNAVKPSKEAFQLAEKTEKDPSLVQLILDESVEVLKHRPGLMIVEHRLGYVHANAGIDQSNISTDPDNPRVLLLPISPDKSAARLRESLQQKLGIDLRIIISDSAGRPWRNGIVGYAIGTAGFEPVVNMLDVKDLFGRELQATEIAVADELAAAASLLMGQAAEGTPVVHIRGAKLKSSTQGSQTLIRDKAKDFFR